MNSISKQRLDDGLNNLRPALESEHARQPLRLDLDCGRLELEVRRVDQLACAWDRLACAAHPLAQADAQQCRRLAEDLASRFSYLLEAIGPLEIDHEGCTVQMRSQPPMKDESGVYYFELLVRRGEIQLCRYGKPPGRPRRVVPATVTREVLHRLVNDLQAAVDANS